LFGVHDCVVVWLGEHTTAKLKADPYGMTNKRTDKGKSGRASLDTPPFAKGAEDGAPVLCGWSERRTATAIATAEADSYEMTNNKEVQWDRRMGFIGVVLD
jgi:hypothetical protein